MISHLFYNLDTTLQNLPKLVELNTAYQTQRVNI